MSLSKRLGHGLAQAEARQSGTAKIARYPDWTLDWTLDWTGLNWAGLDSPVPNHMTSNDVVMEEPQRQCCDHSCSTAVPKMHNNAA